jgi:hypothetical protein
MGGKDTVWALYYRAMLLWNACVRIRHDTSFSDLDRRDFAMRAWMETEAIEKALGRHTCSIERAFMFHGREYLFKCVTAPSMLSFYKPVVIRWSVPITAPGCAFPMNFRDSFPMCEFLAHQLSDAEVDSAQTLKGDWAKPPKVRGVV